MPAALPTMDCRVDHALQGNAWNYLIATNDQRCSCCMPLQGSVCSCRKSLRADYIWLHSMLQGNAGGRQT